MRHWRLLALGGAAVVMSLLVQHFVYPALSWNRDEATYLWQMRGLRSGDLLTTTGGAPEFFRPWLTGVRDGQFFSQYTLGWPVVMLVYDVLFGSPLLAMATGTVLAVLGTYVFARELTRDENLSLLAAALLLCCPIVVTQSGVYLGYLFSLGIGLFFATALLSGVRGNRPRMMVAAGALLGVLFVTRPFDAVLWAAAIGLYAALVTWRAWSRHWRGALLVMVGFAPFLLITLWHNHTVTGSFTTFPFSAKEPLDTFGFGARRILPNAGGIDYGLREAVKGVSRNFWYLPRFLVGSYLALALAFVGLWIRRRDRTTIVLLLIVVMFPFGYFFFWGTRLSSYSAFLSGPVYFLPLYVPICVFVATAILGATRRRAPLVALGAAVVVATVPFLVGALDDNHRMSLAQQPWQHITDPLPGRSLVFIRDAGSYLLHLDPYSQNAPDLDGRVLYAVDRGAHDLGLIAAYPDRTPYVVRTSEPELDNAIDHPDAGVPTITVLPARVVRGGAITLRVAVRRPAHASSTVVALRAGKQRDRRTSGPTTPRDVVTTEWTLVAPGSESGAPGEVPLDGSGHITIVTASGSSAASALAGRRAQVQYGYRVVDGMLEILEPSRQSIVKDAVSGQTVRRDVAQLPGVDVVVQPN